MSDGDVILIDLLGSGLYHMRNDMLSLVRSSQFFIIKFTYHLLDYQFLVSSQLLLTL